jgi:hypothetical protein
MLANTCYRWSYLFLLAHVIRAYIVEEEGAALDRRRHRVFEIEQRYHKYENRRDAKLEKVAETCALLTDSRHPSQKTHKDEEMRMVDAKTGRERKSREQRAESREQRAESREQRIESKEQRTEREREKAS